MELSSDEESVEEEIAELPTKDDKDMVKVDDVKE